MATLAGPGESAVNFGAPLAPISKNALGAVLMTMANGRVSFARVLGGPAGTAEVVPAAGGAGAGLRRAGCTSEILYPPRQSTSGLSLSVTRIAPTLPVACHCVSS